MPLVVGKENAGARSPSEAARWAIPGGAESRRALAGKAPQLDAGEALAVVDALAIAELVAGAALSEPALQPTANRTAAESFHAVFTFAIGQTG